MELPCGLLAVEISNASETVKAGVPVAGCMLELDGKTLLTKTLCIVLRHGN